jgi:hypothetical protein
MKAGRFLFAVILAIPFGILGAFLAIWTRDMTNDIYFQIGLVTLIGLAAKNAILIVEFANQRLAAGMSLARCGTGCSTLAFPTYHYDIIGLIFWVYCLWWWLRAQVQRAGIPSAPVYLEGCWRLHFGYLFRAALFCAGWQNCTAHSASSKTRTPDRNAEQFFQRRKTVIISIRISGAVFSIQPSFSLKLYNILC